MSFPDIPLDAINRAASQLFGRNDSVTDNEALELRHDLLEKLGELDRVIASIDGQLATRKDNSTWRSSAKRARRDYNRQRDSILQFLGTVNVILNNVNAHNARVAKTTRKHEEICHYQETLRVHQLEKHQLKTARIVAANNDNERFLAAFKKVCKESLGEERYMELVTETNRRLSAEGRNAAPAQPSK
jgi:hypothetical protein